MAGTHEVIDERLASFLCAQPVFFVATAPLSGDGLVNCSPKGNRGEFAVLGERRVAYLDQTGSGIETVAHLRENGRIVLMFCSFGPSPRIVRLHGSGAVVAATETDFAAAATCFLRPVDAGTRSMVIVDVSRIGDSCGFGVPIMEFSRHRPTMDEWAARKGEPGIRAYWSAHNRDSLDGLPGLSLPEEAL